MRWLVGVLVVALVPVGVPTVAAEPSCTGGPLMLFCAEATSEASVDCSLFEVENVSQFSCDFSALHAATGFSLVPAPGQLAVPSTVEVGVCNGAGLCEQTVYPVGTPCSWGLGGTGCQTGGVFTLNESEELQGCLYVWISQDINARVRLPDSSQNLAQDSAQSFMDYDSCAGG